MAAVNTMFVLSSVGVNPLGATKIPTGALRGVAGALKSMGQFGKFLRPAVKLFGGLVRFAGPVWIGLVALNTALKMFTGKGILGQFGVGVKDATEKLKNFEKELAGKGTEERVQARDLAQSNVARLEGNREFFQGIVGAIPTKVDKRSGIERPSRPLTKQEKFARKQLGIIEGSGEGSLSAAQGRLTTAQKAVDRSAAGIASGASGSVSTGRFASEFLRDFGALGQGQLAVSGVGEEGVTGNRKKLLEEELKLAQDQGTADKFNIESRIAGLKFEIDASKQRFQLTDEFTKNLEKGGAISQKSLNIIKEQVESGGDLNDIQEALTAEGEKLSNASQKILTKDLLRLSTLNKKLAAQKDELKNEQAIIAFKQKQFKIEQNLTKLLAKNKAQAGSETLGREVNTRSLSFQTSRGPISSS